MDFQIINVANFACEEAREARVPSTITQ